MTIIDKKLIDAYTVVVMAERITLEEVPDREIILDDGTVSTMRKEVEIRIAEKTIDVLEKK